jgi:hypothetical protein
MLDHPRHARSPRAVSMSLAGVVIASATTVALVTSGSAAAAARPTTKTAHGQKPAPSPSPSPSLSPTASPSPTPSPTATATSYDATTVSAVAADADWILRTQMSDGAITTQTDHHAVWPYLANFAAEGLAQATRVTGNATYESAAWKWLAWYAAHEDSNGFVTDYVWNGSAMASSGTMDSTDAYAGTFLTAARAAWIVSPDVTRLSALHAGIAGAVQAIEATQDSDGLTWAKPSWHVKYLMDVAETYSGLRSAVVLGQALGDTVLADHAASDAAKLKAGIDSLWDTSAANYHYAKYDSGVLQSSTWAFLYPDALEQAWAVAYGVTAADRSTALMSTFTQAQPRWSDPTATATFDSGTQTVGYWPVAGWALLRANRAADALAAAASIRQAAVAAGRVWPYTSGNSGQLIVLESAALDLVTP